MPASGFKREYPLTKLFLSAYDNASWGDCEPVAPYPDVWPDTHTDGEVDFLGRRSDKRVLAIEHTLIEPFVGDKENFSIFRPFLSIEEDPLLAVPGRAIYVNVPVGTLRVGRRREHLVVRDLHDWLRANIPLLPEGKSQQVCQLSSLPGKGNLALDIRVQVIRNASGKLLIRRYGEGAVGQAVEKALKAKLEKLVNTGADLCILLFERDQLFWPHSLTILDEIEKRRIMFPNLTKVHEIGFVETAVFETQKYVYFELYNGTEFIETFDFQEGQLLHRQNHR